MRANPFAKKQAMTELMSALRKFVANGGTVDEAFAAIKADMEEAADAYRTAQAEKMFALFAAANHRQPESSAELGAFLDAERAAGRLPAGPIDPYR